MKDTTLVRNCIWSFCLFNHQTARLWSTDLGENLWSDIWLGIEEVQHVARMLNAVLCRLLWGGEAVVPGTVEVFETARAVLELVALAGYNGLLLGHTARGDDVPNLKCLTLMMVSNLQEIEGGEKKTQKELTTHSFFVRRGRCCSGE